MKTDTITIQVLILFVMIAVGFIARKCRLLNNELNNGLTEILLNITVPFTIITSFNLTYSVKLLHNMLIILFCGVFAHLLAAVISIPLFYRYPKSEQKILRFVTIFSNTGFMGLPVLQSLFGKMGIFYGSIYVVIFNIFVWTLGVMIFSGRKNLNIRKALTNPALIAVGIGSVLFFCSIKLPYPIYKPIDLIGSITTPLSMMIIGSILAGLKWKELFAGFPVYYGSFSRLLLVPLVVAGIFHLIKIPENLIRICIPSVAMPAATMTAIFAEKYQENTLLASRIVFISTALSILTLPFVLVLV